MRFQSTSEVSEHDVQEMNVAADMIIEEEAMIYVVIAVGVAVLVLAGAVIKQAQDIATLRTIILGHSAHLAGHDRALNANKETLDTHQDHLNLLSGRPEGWGKP